MVDLDWKINLKLSGVVLGLFTRPRNPKMGYTVKPECKHLD